MAASNIIVMSLTTVIGVNVFLQSLSLMYAPSPSQGGKWTRVTSITCAEPVLGGFGFTLGVPILVVTANRHSSSEPLLIMQDH